MSHNLLDQADALMRRRVFVAGANAEAPAPQQPTPAAPIHSSADGSLEHVPVLTDVVFAQDIQPAAEVTVFLNHNSSVERQIEASESLSFNQLLMERQAVLTREIETWLDEQLPQLVIRAMDGITDHLVALLANRARDELLPRLEAALHGSDEAKAGTDSAE